MVDRGTVKITCASVPVALQPLEALRPEPLHRGLPARGLGPLPGRQCHAHVGQLPPGVPPGPRGVQHGLQDAPARVDEPVVDLEEAEAGLPGEVALLVLGRVGVLKMN